MTIRKGTKIIAGNNSASTLYPDNKTIKKDSFNKIAVNAVKDQNIGVTKFWSGTLAEYTSIEHDSDTIYHITDDTCEEQTSSILNEEILQQLSQKLDNTQLYNKITNCLLEVPQRIKLELNDGVLTLKAGSEVIIPNGFEEDGTTPKFDYVIVENDLTGTTGDEADYMYCISNDAILTATYTQYYFSSSTAPSSPSVGNVWFDTSTNLVKKYINNAWVSGYSLPVCIARTTAIKQVFNGFGYIGSTVWIDKDVKALIPNGRNEDYSLNNIIHTTPKLLIRQFPTNANGDYYIGIDLSNDDYIVPQDIIVLDRKSVMYEQATRPNVTMAKWLDTTNNQYYFWNEADTRPEIKDLYKLKDLFVATCYVKDAVITSYSPKQPIKALNEQDKPIISAWSMPSSKYIDLTLGASGTEYTAPANGWIAFNKAGNSGEFGFIDVKKENSTSNLFSSSMNLSAHHAVGIFVPVRRGQKFVIGYSLSAELNWFRFIYAEGDI